MKKKKLTVIISGPKQLFRTPKQFKQSSFHFVFDLVECCNIHYVGVCAQSRENLRKIEGPHVFQWGWLGLYPEQILITHCGASCKIEGDTAVWPKCERRKFGENRLSTTWKSNIKWFLLTHIK